MDLKGEGRKVPICFTSRWVLSYVSFFAFLFVYAFRINFSVAIVCMIKSNATGSPNDSSTQGEFDWDKTTEGYMLGSFFYGYLVMQIPGGILASRFGGKHVFGTGMFITIVATLVLPVCARAHFSLVIVLRVIMGLGTGVVFPAMNILWARWAPPLERSQLMTFGYAGTMIGNIVTLSASGALCDTGIDGGWPLIFYVFGGAGALWYIAWILLVFDSPEQHPRITDHERLYIQQTIGNSVSKVAKDKGRVPWLKMLTSGPVWAILVAHTLNNWSVYTLLTCQPRYMNDVLKFDIKSNGLFSALPYIAMFFTTLLFGQVADVLRQRKIMTTTAVRKLAQTLGFVPPSAFIIGVGFLDSTQRDLAVALLTISVAFTSGSRAGYSINHVDIAPRYSGVLFGITNTMATVPGILAPMAVAALTPNGTREEWQIVFYICAGTSLVGCLVYLILASGEEQSWAMSTDDKPKDDTYVSSKVFKNNQYDNLGLEHDEKSNGHIAMTNNSKFVTGVPVHRSVDNTDL